MNLDLSHLAEMTAADEARFFTILIDNLNMIQVKRPDPIFLVEYPFITLNEIHQKDVLLKNIPMAVRSWSVL